MSGMAISDIVIEWVCRSCKDLYSLNISRCSVITDMGLLRAKFNLTLLNIVHRNLGFPSIVHALCEFDVQVLCIQRIHITVEESARLDSMFPGCSEIGVPKICGFSLPDFESLTKSLTYRESPLKRSFSREKYQPRSHDLSLSILGGSSLTIYKRQVVLKPPLPSKMSRNLTSQRKEKL